MVSSVSFGKRDIYRKPDLNAPQTNQRQEATQTTENVKPKKKHTVAKVAIGTIAAAAVAAAALAVGSRHADAIKNTLSNIAKKQSWLSWVDPAKGSTGRKVLSGLNSAGETIDNFVTKTIPEGASKLAASVVNMFKK